MRWATEALFAVSLTMAFTTASLGAQAAAPAIGVEHVCTLLSKAEMAKFISRDRERFSEASEMAGICNYGGYIQILVYSGPDAEGRFIGLLKSFKKDTETRFPLTSLGADGWVMYPHPDNQYQSIGAFTHAKVGPHVVSIFIEAEDGKPAESAKDNAEALTKLVMSKLR